MSTKNTDSNKLKKIGSGSKNTSKASNKSKYLDFPQMVSKSGPKSMKTNTQKVSLILSQNEDVKHRVSHNMIKICYGFKGLYQVAGEERF